MPKLLWMIFGAALLSAGLFALPPDEPPKPATPEASIPLSIPDEATQRKNPVTADEASLERSRAVFPSQCGMCHGQRGDGGGDLAQRLGFEMPDFTDANYQKTRTDGELFYILSEGHGHMAGEGDRLNEKTRWDLVNGIRAMTSPRN